MNSMKILFALDTILAELLIFLYSSQAIQNSMFSSLNSVLRNVRKAARPSGENNVNQTGRKEEAARETKTTQHQNNMIDIPA